MSDKKTRLGKIQSENRNLKQENADLKIVNKKLRTKLVGISKNKEKEERYSYINKILSFIYDIAVPNLILVFTYVSINGSMDMSINLMIVLYIFVLAKCLFKNQKLCIVEVLCIFFNDLIKPMLSMILGVALCIFCTGEEWRLTKNLAVDMTTTIVLDVGIIVMIIPVVAFYLTINKVKRWKRIK